MEPFTVVRGPAVPLLLPDINTDVIAPAHAGRGDLARSAFAPLRYLPDGSRNAAFALNQDRFRGAPVLLAGANFGCGSSRETAVWSLVALGFRCVIAPSFSDIFVGNCFQNGVLPIVLDEVTIAELGDEAVGGDPMVVDLTEARLTSPRGRVVPFVVDPARRAQLLEGLDDLALALRRLDQVRAYEASDRRRRPWVYEIARAG